MTKPTYKERMRAARPKHRQSARRSKQRVSDIELRCEVHRLALAAVRSGIQAMGQRKLSTYSRAEFTMMAIALIAPWSIDRSRPGSLNELKTFAKAGSAETQGLSLCETHERNGVAK